MMCALVTTGVSSSMKSCSVAAYIMVHALVCYLRFQHVITCRAMCEVGVSQSVGGSMSMSVSVSVRPSLVSIVVQR